MDLETEIEEFRLGLLAKGHTDGAALVGHCQSLVHKNKNKAAEPQYSLNRDGTVAVSNTVFWSRDMSDAPIQVKVQLYSAGCIASHGAWDGKDPFYKRWAGMPRVPKD